MRQLDALGYGRITMEGVAAEAGVSRATIYRRYRHKADLVTAAIADAAGDGDAGPAPGTTARDPRGVLIGFLEEFDGRFAESCLEVIGGLIGDREEPLALAMHPANGSSPRGAPTRCRCSARPRTDGELAADADMALALQMLAGSVFFRRVSGQPADPGWAAAAPSTPFGREWHLVLVADRSRDQAHDLDVTAPPRAPRLALPHVTSPPPRAGTVRPRGERGGGLS